MCNKNNWHYESRFIRLVFQSEKCFWGRQASQDFPQHRLVFMTLSWFESRQDKICRSEFPQRKKEPYNNSRKTRRGIIWQIREMKQKSPASTSMISLKKKWLLKFSKERKKRFDFFGSRCNAFGVLGSSSSSPFHCIRSAAEKTFWGKKKFIWQEFFQSTE